MNTLDIKEKLETICNEHAFFLHEWKLNPTNLSSHNYNWTSIWNKIDFYDIIIAENKNLIINTLLGDKILFNKKGFVWCE